MTRAMQYIISATLAGMLALAGTLAQAAPGSGREDVGRLRSQFEDARRNLASREADLDRLEREREHDRDEWRHLRQRQAALEAELCREQEVLFALANDLAWRRQVAPGDQWNFDRAVANVAQRRQDLAAADAEASATATALADLRLRAADLVRQSDVDAAAAEAKKRVGFVNAQVDRALDALEKRADYQVVMAAERDLANQIFAALWAEPFDVNAAVQTFGLWIAASDRVTTMRRAAVDNDPQVIALRKDADAAVDVHQALVQRVNDQAPLAQALTDSETRAADADGRRAAAGQSLQDAETDLWRIQDQLAARNAELGPVQLAIFDHRCRAEAIARELDRVRDAAHHADSDDRRGHGPWQAAQVRRDEARASVDDLGRRLHDAEGRETADQRRQREQREQQERRHQEELARAEAQRKAEAERQHKIQEEKEARERVARLDAARPKTADDLRLGMLQEEQKKEAAKKAADAQKAEEARKVEQQRQDQLRKSEEARKADEARKIDEARKAELAKADQARKADEAHEAELAKADRARKAEQARKAEDARKADLAKTDQSRKAEEARKSEEARKAALAQQQKAEEQRKLSEQRDQQAKAEAARKANEARKAEETRKADEARTSAAADAQRKVEDEKRQRDEQARLEAARIRTAEDQRVWIMRQQQQEKQEKEKQENERRQREEAARKADEDRKAAEMRKADEVRRVEEAKDADAARRADAARKADEAKKAEEEKKADEARKAEERRRQQEEAARKAEPAGGPPRRGK